MARSRTFKAGILAVSQGTHVLAMLLIAAVLSRILSKGDYATYRQTMLAFAFVAPLLLMGLPQSLLYFIPRDPDNARGRLIQNLLALTALGASFSLFLLLGGSSFLAEKFNNPDLEQSLRWLVAYPLLVLPIASLQPCLIAMNRVTWVVAYTLVSRLILVAAVLVPVWYVRDPTVAIQGTVAAAAVAFVPGMVLMIRAAPGRVGGSLGAGIREQLKYAVPLGLGAMIGTFNKNIGSVMVAGSSSKEEFAVFVNGALEIPMIVLITGSAASVMLPDLTRFFSEGKFEEAVQLFQRSAVKCGMILIPLTGLLFVVAPALMRALYGEGFTGSAIFFRLYLLILPLRVVMFASLFQAAGRSDLVLKRTIYGLVVMVTLCWGFLHWLGPVGAALATVTTIALYTTPYCVWTCSRLYKTTFFKLLPVRDLFVLVGPMVVLTSVLVLGGEAFSTGNWIADAAISALLYGVLILGLYHLLGIRVLEAFGVTRNLMARK